jgi:Rieske Fe-S protein
MDEPRSTGRRRALRVLAAGFAVTVLPGGCAPGEPPVEAAGPSEALVPLAELEGGARAKVTLRGRPVEVRLVGGEPVATSLRCTHWGCDVHWDGDARRYRCACHDGVFDADGRPLFGPVTKPLRRYPAERRADGVLVRVPGDGA